MSVIEPRPGDRGQGWGVWGGVGCGVCRGRVCPVNKGRCVFQQRQLPLSSPLNKQSVLFSRSLESAPTVHSPI